jgi:hypothetical protein
MFLQFSKKNKTSDGAKLFWGRANETGRPLRTRSVPPLLHEHEYEQKVEEVSDPKFGTFDLADPDLQVMGRTWGDVMLGIEKDWFVWFAPPMYWKERDRKTGRLKVMVFAQWLERYDEMDYET